MLHRTGYIDRTPSTQARLYPNALWIIELKSMVYRIHAEQPRWLSCRSRTGTAFKSHAEGLPKGELIPLTVAVRYARGIRTGDSIRGECHTWTFPPQVTRVVDVDYSLFSLDCEVFFYSVWNEAMGKTISLPLRVSGMKREMTDGCIFCEINKYCSKQK